MNHGGNDSTRELGPVKSKTEEAAENRGPLNSIVVFVATLCCLGFLEGISANGLPFINISSIETRYGLTSSEAGLISSCGDIGAISLLLVVSYYGGRSHRPRVIAAGGFLLGLGSLLFLLPHVLVQPYVFSHNQEMACRAGLGEEECDKDEDNSASRFLPLFMAGQALQGIGFIPVFTCGFAYIDDYARIEDTAVFIVFTCGSAYYTYDNAMIEDTAVFTGLTYAITTLGLGMGYVIGGQFLSLWVDIGRIDHVPSMDPTDSRWVGAWWIGYVICTVLYVVVSTFLSFFPKAMPVLKEQSSELFMMLHKAKPEPSAVSSKERTIGQLLLSLPKALFDLVRNFIYIMLILSGTGDSLIVTGIAIFAPKIIEEKFSVKPSMSGLIMGATTLVGGAGGLALGGFMIRRFHLRLLGILKMSMAFNILAAMLGAAGFFISCPQISFAGVTSEYGTIHGHVMTTINLTADCNAHCSCNKRKFDPVCGEDGLTYFSACYAGCLDGASSDERHSDRAYHNCKCVLATLTGNLTNATGLASPGQCPSAQCPQLWLFVVVLFLGIFFTFLNATPISVAILRTVAEEDRSVGLGLQWATFRLLGTIPAPIVAGAVLDQTCALWQDTCRGQGSCWFSERSAMSLRLSLYWAGVKLCSLLAIVAAYMFYTKRGHAEVDRQEEIISLTFSTTTSGTGTGFVSSKLWNSSTFSAKDATTSPSSSRSIAGLSSAIPEESDTMFPSQLSTTEEESDVTSAGVGNEADVDSDDDASSATGEARVKDLNQSCGKGRVGSGTDSGRQRRESLIRKAVGNRRKLRLPNRTVPVDFDV